MTTSFSPCKGSYVLNLFPSIVMFGMKGFHVSASGAIQGHDGPLVCTHNFTYKGVHKNPQSKLSVDTLESNEPYCNDYHQSSEKYWPSRGSNQRPPVFTSCAHSTELHIVEEGFILLLMLCS